jgi:hypothetical protein
VRNKLRCAPHAGPTREKHGWMGDALDASEQALMNFEIEPVRTVHLSHSDDL